MTDGRSKGQCPQHEDVHTSLALPNLPNALAAVVHTNAFGLIIATGFAGAGSVMSPRDCDRGQNREADSEISGIRNSLRRCVVICSS